MHSACHTELTVLGFDSPASAQLNPCTLYVPLLLITHYAICLHRFLDMTVFNGMRFSSCAVCGPVIPIATRLKLRLPANLRYRFEKYAVSVESFWDLLRTKKDPASCQVVDEVRSRCESLLTTLGEHTCYGAVPGSTVTTILMTVLQEQLPPAEEIQGIDRESLVRALVRSVASQLLQLVRPHAFLQQVYAGLQLPQAYVDFYLHQQEHYNLKQLLGLLGTDMLPELSFEIMQPVSDQPESSAAAVAAASAAGQRVLLKKPPQQKWVIFTCTTPDLEMGYVLPAGDQASPQNWLAALICFLHCLGSSTK